MIKTGKRFKATIAALALLPLLVQSAQAQSILRDAETEALFDDMSAPLIRAAGLDPKNVKIVMVGDDSINAFVAGGQVVYVNSGLVTRADNANEVQGVISHELGHVAGGHVIRSGEGIKEASGISLLSLVLGAAAIAAGAGEAGAGILGVGQQIAVNRFLGFSRTQEASADAAGQSYLIQSGITGEGMLSFFKKLQGVEYRLAISQDNGYARTHPLTGERIARLEDKFRLDPAWKNPVDQSLEARFQRVKAKLKGFSGEPRQTLIEYPESDRSVPARYARAYAWHRSAYPDKAIAEINSLLAAAPVDPYFLELKGQILLESGKPEEAISVLRTAVDKTNAQPLIASLFGHALIATENQANLAEAQKVLKAAVSRDNENPDAWYQLGVVYGATGDNARAAMASAERFHLQGQPQLALANAQVAVRTLPTGSADWLRAQDVLLVSQAAVGDRKRR
ncbi:MAG: M48 family metalloprotease [Pseudomonadota bacterium]